MVSKLGLASPRFEPPFFAIWIFGPICVFESPYVFRLVCFIPYGVMGTNVKEGVKNMIFIVKTKIL